ncbi:DUF983 domain-containing protein [Pseudofulvibacter geojedonensis]|uniref:DUF983 domain-containing protein n=1 Tax=Pseudofulvibacter geojedonensis TaxID=1123758 RepID=A0ABW3I3A1_9FLAO
MLGKGSKIYSIITGSCPRCHDQSMYKVKNPFLFLRALDMHEKCSNCQLKYQIEPSFFYGAMYVSYAVGIAFAVAAYIISKYVFNADILMSFISITITLIVFLPVITRLSRNLWINMFIKYNNDARNDSTS